METLDIILKKNNVVDQKWWKPMLEPCCSKKEKYPILTDLDEEDTFETS
jgi:hypothetical protein